MSLFARGIVPEPTQQELFELRSYLSAVVAPKLDEIIRFWDSGAFGVTQDRMFQMSQDAQILRCELSLASMQMDRIAAAIQKAQQEFAKQARASA